MNILFNFCVVMLFLGMSMAQNTKSNGLRHKYDALVIEYANLEAENGRLQNLVQPLQEENEELKEDYQE